MIYADLLFRDSTGSYIFGVPAQLAPSDALQLTSFFRTFHRRHIFSHIDTTGHSLEYHYRLQSRIDRKELEYQ